MNELDLIIRDARRRLVALVEIVRWLWIVNAAVMVLGLVYGSYQIAALAGFTWILSVVAAAIARRTVAYLRAATHTMRST
jgi:hypothetical protein